METKTPKRIRRRRCTVCKDLFSGWGNNAEPVAEGQCCDACNDDIVIPTRIRQLLHVFDR